MYLVDYQIWSEKAVKFYLGLPSSRRLRDLHACHDIMRSFLISIAFQILERIRMLWEFSGNL